MDAGSEVVMFRRPMDNDIDSQVFVYNSPIQKIDQQIVVYRNPNEVVVFKREYVIYNNTPDCNCSKKRSFLNECINQVYLINGFGNKVHFDNSVTVTCNADVIKQHLDHYTQPDPSSPWRNRLDKIKKRLFQRGQVRKQNNVHRNPNYGATEAMNMKPVRHLFERMRIRRGFLNPVRKTIVQEMLNESLDDNNITTPEIRDRIEEEARYIEDMSAETIARLTERAKRMDAAYTHERMRIALENHRMMMEESVRSIMYARQLYLLMTRNEEGKLFSSSFWEIINILDSHTHIQKHSVYFTYNHFFKI